MAAPRGRGITAYLSVIAAGALVHGIYLGVFSAKFPFAEQPIRDSLYFDSIARLLLSGGLPDGPFYRAPGYPLFLSLIYRLLGPDPLRVAIVQVLLVLAATALTMRTAARLFGNREAILAGVMVVGSGSICLFESRLTPEVLALFLAAALVTALTSAETGQPVPASWDEEKTLGRAIADGVRPPPLTPSRRAWAILAGFSAGLLAITRAEYGLAALAIGAALLFRAGARRRPVSLGALYASGLALVLVPVAAHNLRHGAVNPVCVSGGVALYRANAPGAAVIPDPDAGLSPRETRAGLSGYWLTEETEADSLISADLGRVPAPGQAYGYWIGRVAAEIAGDPARWFRQVAAKVPVLLGRPVESHNVAYGLELDRVPILRVAAVPFNFLAIAGAAGIYLATSGKRRGARASILAPVAVLTAAGFAGILFFPEEDVRVPVIPILAMFAAHTLSRADLASRTGDRRALLVATGIGFVLLVVTSVPRHPLRQPERETRFITEAGIGFEGVGRDAAAGEQYRDALTLDPKNVEALVRLGQLAMKRTELTEAIGYFEKARDAAPRDFSVRNNLGILYYQAQRLDATEREMTEAAALAPDDPGPWFYRALAKRKLEDPAAAELYFHEALARDSRYVGAYVRLIELLLDQGRKVEAVDWADRAGVNGVAMPREVAERLR